jgi:hypothetical protein
MLATVADAPACTSLDPAELLDVDVDELARPRALVADRLLEPEPAELAHPNPRQDPGDGRERHSQRLRDLSRREAEPAQLRDHLDPIGRGAVCDMLRCRGAIVEAGQALKPVAASPLSRTANADSGRRCRRRDRPTLDDDELAQPPSAAPAESGVSVKIHPVTSLGPSCL